MIVHTCVRVSEEHRAVAMQRARGVVETPLVVVHGVSLNDAARLGFGDWLDELAVAYGLLPPPVENGETIHYGMTNEGEFTRWVGECPPQDILGT